MKRNLFAIFLAVIVVVALVFAVAPTTQAATVIEAKANDEVIDVQQNSTVDLKGFKNVTVNVTSETAVELSFVDTSFMLADGDLDLTGDNAGTVKITGNYTVKDWVQYGDYKYLKVENGDTLSFHPFNLSITRLGINTTKNAVCIKAVFIANDVVAKLIDEKGEIGVHNYSLKDHPEYAEKEYTPIDRKFGEKNGIDRYYSLMGSLDQENLTSFNTLGAYLKLGELTIDSLQTVDITPKDVLANINQSYETFSDAKKAMLVNMIGDKAYLEHYCVNFVPGSASKHTWSYNYAWEGAKCTATRICGCAEAESETVSGQILGISPATKTTAGKASYAATFENAYFNENFKSVEQIPAGTPFSITAGGTQHYAFDGVTAGKNYYIEIKVNAPSAAGYVGIAHWGDDQNYFYDTVSSYGAENYYHKFSGVVNGAGRVYGEPAKYFEGNNHNGLTGVNFAESGMTITSVRTDDRIYTFINGKRIATYVVEDEIAAMDTIPVLYFYDASGTYYDGEISNISIVCGAEAAVAKVAELNTGSAFNYVATPNWQQSKLDATFNDDGGFSYAYDSSNTTTGRRFFNGVNDRVFLADDYYYQYEISGDMAFENVSDSYGLFFNWINTKTLSSTIDYKHEVNFCMHMNGGPLNRLTFDKGNGATGDGLKGGWVSNTTEFGGQNNLTDNSAWQEAIKGGLIIRIERTVVNSTTDSYVFTVIAKSNPDLVIKSTPIEVSNADFGGYNWILFGTQSIDCTISNVQFGKPVKEDPDAGKLPVDESFTLTEGGRQHYEFAGINASKNYYIQMQLSAPTTAGYVGVAHWADADNYFYDVVSYDATENYYHAFASAVNGAGRVYEEPAKYYEGKTVTDFGTNGMTITSVRTGDRIYTFINGVRIATYLIEEELAAMDLVPALYFCDRSGNYYNGEISNITIVTGETEAIAKVAELTTGSSFDYVNTPNFDLDKQNGSTKNVHTDATFNDNGFTYAYDATVSVNDRRFATGVGDRVFMTGNYYYQYEISGDIVASTGSNVYGLFYNWINTKTLSEYTTYRHEANFVLKMNGTKLQRLTFAPGSGSNGDGLKPDGSADWVSNTTAYGGNNTLESDTAWQTAFKSGLIVRIEHTVVDGDTDSFVISVTTKDGAKTLTSTAMEVSDVTFGGYTWVQFGTQSVECTVSNVEFGHK
jgi:hypothetical protein